MAERRMFAKTIIDSDAFLDMPLSTQALYFHLCMRADDEGFVNNPKKILRMIGASDDDAKVLISKKFIIPFDSGVVVIKHWRIHNYIRADRLKATNYEDERSKLGVKDNGSYTLCQSNVSQLSDTCPSNVSIGKDRLGKDSIDKDSIDNTCQRSADEDDIKEVVDAFKEICISLPKPQVISETRKKNIRGKLKEYGIDTLKLAFQKMEASDFLSGRDGAWTGCSFDWVIQYKGNIIKVLEGNYDNKNSADIKAVNDMRKMTEGMTREEYEEMERTFK